MPEILHLRAGETRQLRQPPEGVGRWVSNAPETVAVTDEDVVSGRPGGVLTALRAGRATVTAAGLDNRSVVGEWEVEVAACDLVVRLAQNETAELPRTPVVARWTIVNPRVAEVTGDGVVRGLAPGVTTASGPGAAGVVECRIEVTGTLDVNVDREVNLAERVECPVKSWRTSSPGEVPVDARGVVRTGSRPRTVEVSAELESGGEFRFRLRIAGASPGAALPAAGPPATAVAGRPTQSADPDWATGPVPVTEAGPGPVPDQGQAVRERLQAAEAALVAGDWAGAGRELTAARMAAVTQPELQARVEQVAGRLRSRVAEGTARGLTEAVRLLAAGDHPEALRRLGEIQAPRDLQPLVEGARRLAGTCGRFTETGDEPAREELERHLAALWNDLVRQQLDDLLPPLMALGLQHGERVVALALELLGDPARGGMPTSVRQALGQMLGDAATPALDWIIGKLKDAATRPDQVDSLLDLLPDLALQRQAAGFIRAHGRCTSDEQVRLAGRLAQLHPNRTKALFDLLGGVVNRMPPDLRLARALQRAVGAEKLEQAALRWAGGGHRGAKALLERLYDYPPDAFG